MATKEAKAKIDIPSAEGFLKARTHLGHPAKRWHPKMKSYIVKRHASFHVLNPEVSRAKLEAATKLVFDVVAKGGQMLLVGTKLHAKHTVKEEALRGGLWYVNERWMGGTLTNFETVEGRIKRLVELADKNAKSDDASGTKRSTLRTRTELRRLDKFFDGIKEMDKLPELLFVVDIGKEEIAVREARIAKIPCIGIVDTNCNPEAVDYPIPANDDSLSSIKLIVTAIVDAAVAGRKEFSKRLELQMSEDFQPASSEPAERESPAKADEVAPADEPQADALSVEEADAPSVEEADEVVLADEPQADAPSIEEASVEDADAPSVENIEKEAKKPVRELDMSNIIGSDNDKDVADDDDNG